MGDHDQNNEMLENVLTNDDPNQANLPAQGDEDPGVLSDSDELSDEEVDDGEIVDLLDDAHRNDEVPIVHDDVGDPYYEEGSLDDEDVKDVPQFCAPMDEVSVEEPSLVSEPDEGGRSGRSRRPPERYNPETGDNYAMIGEM